MSFTADDGDKNILISRVIGGSSDGEEIFLEDENARHSNIIKRKPTKTVECDDGIFELVPNSKVRVIYIVGAAGAGKSVWASKYCKAYLKMNKKAKFYVFSQLDNDPALDPLKPHRVTLGESLIENPIDIISDIEEGSLILFDDCSDNEEKLQKAIDALETKIMVHGRKHNIQLVITSHLVFGNNPKLAKYRMLECSAFTFFPRSGSTSQVSHALKAHFGFSARQISSILNIDSRWVCITKTYPNILLSEHMITFAKDIGKIDEK